MERVIVEPLWRSLNYARVHVHAFETGLEFLVGMTRWIRYANERQHLGRAGHVPNEVHGVKKCDR